MRPIKVIAIVVSFKGGEKTLKTIDALLPQVDHVHVVDNGSDLFSLDLLGGIKDERVSIRKLGENLGIGGALNAGLLKARQLDCSWVLTMDQDSIAAPDMVGCLIKTIVKNDDVLCLSPNLIVHGDDKSPLKIGSVPYAITSGNMVNMEIYNSVGDYNEDYFIDCVDFDFSLRVRKAGFKIFKDPNAFLYHELGEKNDLPKLFKRYYTLHSPLRRYYMFRNFLYLTKEYLFSDFKFIFKLFFSHLILFTLLIFYDPKPATSVRMIFQGVLDYFSGKVGAFERGTK